jgi:hypothetical protein
MTAREAIANRLRAVFGLDVRSLALFRIAVGLLLLADLIFRGADFPAMYADGGFAPVEMVRSLQHYNQWSLHLISGAAGYQAALFIAAAALALALLVGYHTRLATIGSWILLASLQVRLPVVLSAADLLLRVLLFWSMFLPLGAVWSLDARRRPALSGTRVVSAATVAFILQLSIVYWMTGWAKWNDAWLKEDALGDILSTGLFCLPLGRTLGEYPELTRWLSRAVVWFELLGPCLLFVPFQTARLRLIAVAAFIFFHIGIAVTVAVGLFSYVAMAAWLALVPGAAWVWMAGLRKAAKENAVAVTSSAAAYPSDSARRKGARFMAALLCWAALAIVVCVNWRHVTKRPLPNPLDKWLTRAAQLTTLEQFWGMFGEAPPEDCWFVYQVLLKDGRRLDLLSRQLGTDHAEPMLAWQQFPSDRWRKLHWNLLSDFGRPYRQPLAEYICRRWNETHAEPEQIVRFDLYCHLQPFDSTGDDRFVRTTLAEVAPSPEGGNFAEAVRALEPF